MNAMSKKEYKKPEIVELTSSVATQGKTPGKTDGVGDEDGKLMVSVS